MMHLRLYVPKTVSSCIKKCDANASQSPQPRPKPAHHWCAVTGALQSCDSRAQRYPMSRSSQAWVLLDLRGNDPSAGSPTETLLRLHLPLDSKVYSTSQEPGTTSVPEPPVRRFHRTIQSVGATGGVYKGQGRNQCKLMTCVY